MKIKAIFGMAVALGVLVALWGWFHHAPPAAKPSPVASAPTSTLQPALVPPQPVRMVAIATPPVRPAPSFNPSQSPWTDIQIIADVSQDYPLRAQAITRLPTKLSEADCEALQKFLLKKDPADDTQLGQVLKNQLMDTLCDLRPLPRELGDVLAQIYEDRNQNGVLRDYAVQHLATYYEQLAGNEETIAAQERQKVQKVLWEALEETNDSIGGTALLGLTRTARGDSRIKGRLGQAALKMAQSETGGELTRITAYQVCAQLSVQEALPLIEAAAQNGQTLPLQISAIGALGMLGGPEETSLLNRLREGAGPRLKPALDRALAQIAGRQTGLGNRN